MEKSEKCPSVPGVQIRQATMDDLPVIDALMARVGYNVGLHNLKIYFRTSSERWQVAVSTESGETVAFDSNNVLKQDNMCMGYNMYVRDDFRSRGIIRAFGTVYDQKLPSMGNATSYSLKQIYFEKWDMKLLGFGGVIKADSLDHFTDTPSGIRVDIADQDEALEQVVAYDKTIFHVDREQFNREWCGDQQFSRTLIAMDERGQCLGYGTLRTFPGYCGLMPMYANDASVARRLLARCAEVVGSKENFYMFFDSKNHLMLETAHKWGLECCDTEVRDYSWGGDEIKQYIDQSRVYAMHEYWPI